MKRNMRVERDESSLFLPGAGNIDPQAWHPAACLEFSKGLSRLNTGNLTLSSAAVLG